jgi:hypothetical protein
MSAIGAASSKFNLSHKIQTAILQGYGYTAPMVLPFFMLSINPWLPLCSDQGLRIWRPETGLSLFESFGTLAF